MALEIFRLVGSVMVDGDKAKKSLADVDKKAGDSSNKIAEAFKKIAGAAVAAFSVNAIKDFALACVGAASDVEEMENKFNVVFQGMTDEVDKWAKDYAGAIGRNSNTIKGYLADKLIVGMVW